MATNQVVQNSNDQVGSNSATSDTTVAAGGVTPTLTPVIAPMGLRQELQQMLQGWQSVIPSDSTMQSSVGSLTQAGVVGKLQGWIGLYTALDIQATAYKQARVPVKAMQSEARQYLNALKSALTGALGLQSTQLVQFGLKPRKERKPLTAQQLAVRAAKAMATRKLRGTKGPVQKAKVKVGPMKFIDPVETTASVESPAQTTAAPSPGDAASSAASSAPVVK